MLSNRYQTIIYNNSYVIENIEIFAIGYKKIQYENFKNFYNRINKLIMIKDNFFNNLFIFICDFMIECRNISKGKAEGELIVSSEAISFLGGVDPETGVVIDPNHELKGESIKGKVLFIPGGKGSTVGSYVIFQMMKNNTAPKAIICLKAEPIIATGAIMSDIPMVDSPSSVDELVNGQIVEVDSDNGKITLL